MSTNSAKQAESENKEALLLIWITSKREEQNSYETATNRHTRKTHSVSENRKLLRNPERVGAVAHWGSRQPAQGYSLKSKTWLITYPGVATAAPEGIRFTGNKSRARGGSAPVVEKTKENLSLQQMYHRQWES